MSYRGRVLILNNQVSTALWHCLACVDPPPTLLSHIQRILDFFWDKLHWVPQSILFLPKDEGGQGLVHLASRGDAFRLQFIQRSLTGPEEGVWRSLSCCILQRCSGLWYNGTVWKPFGLSVGGTYAIRAAEICWSFSAIGQVVELAGPRLDKSDRLAAWLGLKSIRSLLELEDPAGVSVDGASGKTVYRLMVKTLNHSRLRGRSDTPWRAHLDLVSDFRPAWRSLFKPPLIKKTCRSTVEDPSWQCCRELFHISHQCCCGGQVSFLQPQRDSFSLFF